MRTFDEHLNTLSAERRAKIERRTEELIATVKLEELRRKCKNSQKTLAERMDVSQPAVSQMESEGIMSLQTLRKFAEGLGAKLNIIIEFPNGETHRIME